MAERSFTEKIEREEEYRERNEGNRKYVITATVMAILCAVLTIVAVTILVTEQAG